MEFPSLTERCRVSTISTLLITSREVETTSSPQSRRGVNFELDEAASVHRSICLSAKFEVGTVMVEGTADSAYRSLIKEGALSIRLD